MIEADVWKALISVLRSGLDANGLSQVEIHQAYQPIKQGPSSTESVYLHKITSQRVGHQGRQYEYNSDNDNFDETEKYWLSVTIQLMSQVRQDISDVDSITAYDVTEKCAAIMQTRNTRQALLASGISLLNNKAISVAFSTDDKDEFDLDPTFDIVLLYEQTILSTVPKASPITGEIIEVSQLGGAPEIPTFRAQIKTTAPGEAFVIPFEAGGNYDCVVTDGQGNTFPVTVWNQAEATIIYTNPGTHDLEVTGVMTGWKFNNSASAPKMYEVSEWGNFALLPSAVGTFHGCSNMTWVDSAIGGFLTPGVTNMQNMFFSCKVFNDPLTKFDTSQVTSMNNMFFDCDLFNQDLLNFDTANVTNFSFMFRRADIFNGSLASFDTSKGTNFSRMFDQASTFDQSVAHFNIGLATNMSDMFNGITMSTVNYNPLILSYSAQAQSIIANFDGGNSKYTGGGAVEAARNVWVGKGWVITDGGIA